MITGHDYDRIWGGVWGDIQEFGPTHTHVRRLLYSMIKGCPFESVLDAGCGNGVNIRFFLDQFPQIRKIAGFDISDVALAAAAQRCPEAATFRLDVQKAFLDERFDLVYSSDVLEHLQEDRAALHHLYRMTGRYLLVSTLQGRMRKFEEKIGHVRNYGKGELERKISEAGFTIKRKIEWGWPFFSPHYRNLLDIGSMNDHASSGTSWARRCMGTFLYVLFSFNSFKRGDIICILAENTETVAAQDHGSFGKKME